MFSIYEFIIQSIKRLSKLERLPIMLLMAIITLAILGWLVFRDRSLFLNFKWEFHSGPILFSFLIYTFDLFLATLVWSKVMNSLGGKACFYKHFRLFCISNLGKRLPGSVWYIPWRGNMYKSMGISSRLVSVASGIEFAVSEISGVIVCLVFAIPMLVRFRAGLWVSIGLMVISLAVIHPAVIRKIGRLLKVEFTQFGYIDILGWIITNSLVWVTGGVLFFFVVNIFYTIPFTQMNYVIGAWVAAGTLTSALILLPSNFGFTEISLSLLLSVIIPSSIAVMVAVGTRIIILAYELLWALAMMGIESWGKKEITL